MAVVALDQVRTLCDLPTSAMPDTELRMIVDMCEHLLAEDVRTELMAPDDYTIAISRMVSRNVTAQGIPLGAQATEYGTMYVPRNDPVFAKMVAPYWRGGFA